MSGCLFFNHILHKQDPGAWLSGEHAVETLTELFLVFRPASLRELIALFFVLPTDLYYNPLSCTVCSITVDNSL